ncbi:hypothetical protein CYMTET_51525 [Cymbomonas tetramitiformis]|uniref:Uncharacterized protein n=1 Tax=Cymbomonas tetramitiformis TaxID=36881 RepID=A0AAE0BKV4_9CHLO|nr:hypothetical protein CYMTET_51525 [Cymbomonas tetramitiformis]
MQDPEQEDKMNILLATGIMKMMPWLPIRLMLILPESCDRAIEFNIKPYSCFSIQQQVAELMSLSVQCPGISTVLLNCARQVEPVFEDELNQPDFRECMEPWVPGYLQGVAMEIYGCLLQKDFKGMTFTRAALFIWQKTRGVLIAAMVGGRVIPNPAKTKIKENTVCFIIASDRIQLKSVIRPDLYEWRNVFFRERHKMHIIHNHDGARRNSLAVTRFHKPSSTINKFNNNGGMLESVSNKFFFGKELMSGKDIAEDNTNNKSGNRWNLRLMDEAEEGLDLFSKFKMFTSHASESYSTTIGDIEEMQSSIDHIISHGNHIVFVAFSGNLWGQIIAFIQPLRMLYLAVYSHIIVLCSETAPPELCKMFHCVVFVKGDPWNKHHLERLNIHTAKFVVTFDGNSLVGHNESMMDHRTILLQDLLQSGVIAGGAPARYNALLCMHSPHNYRQLSEQKLGMMEKGRSRQYSHVPGSGRSTPGFRGPHVPGEEIGDSIPEDEEEGANLPPTPSPIDALQNLKTKRQKKARRYSFEAPERLAPELTAVRSKKDTFITKQLSAVRLAVANFFFALRRFGNLSLSPAMLKENMISKQMVLPHMHPQFAAGCCCSIGDITRLFAYAFHTPGTLELLRALACPLPKTVSEISSLSMLWSWSIPEQFHGQTFDDLYTACAKHNVVVMALQRPGERSSSLPYVSCAPPADTVLGRGDLAMALGNLDWAKKNVVRDEFLEIVRLRTATRTIEKMLGPKISEIYKKRMGNLVDSKTMERGVTLPTRKAEEGHVQPGVSTYPIEDSSESPRSCLGGGELTAEDPATQLDPKFLDKAKECSASHSPSLGQVASDTLSQRRMSNSQTMDLTRGLQSNSSSLSQNEEFQQMRRNSVLRTFPLDFV